ncbi:MAG TPA: hypothetical protein GXZ24_00290 [Firmicutes bacterium]|jgi:hypothetical protein|nr:hypothetical protein [Bacillota bacterium]
METEKDKILEELYLPLEDLASGEETDKLKEIAWHLVDMGKAEPSSSFQSELRDSLLREVPQLQAAVWSDKFTNKWLKQFYRDLWGPTSRFRSSFAFIAATLIIVVMAVFSHQPADPPGRVADPQRPAYEEQTAQRGIHSATPGKISPGKKPDSEETGDPAAEETWPGSPVMEGPMGTPEVVGPQSGEAVFPEEEILESGFGQNEPPIPEKPKFQIEGEMRDFHLAGAVILSPLHVGDTEGEKSPHENTQAVLRPNSKYATATTPEREAEFGSATWAARMLKNEGFEVRSGDNLEITIQETLQGNFAEIFYQSGGKGSGHPLMVLLCKEPGTILGYYYQEKGSYNKAGYYPLMTPAQALKAQQLTVFSSSRPSLIFTDVRFEFSTFHLDDGRTQQESVLPAYCFTGRETISDSEIKICLPAISR